MRFPLCRNAAAAKLPRSMARCLRPCLVVLAILVVAPAVMDAGVQAAIEAPRLRLFSGNRLVLENRVSEDVVSELRSRGHEVELIDAFSPAVGGGQGILIDPDTGAYSGGGDPRRDGTALGY